MFVEAVAAGVLLAATVIQVGRARLARWAEVAAAISLEGLVFMAAIAYYNYFELLCLNDYDLQFIIRAKSKLFMVKLKSYSFFNFNEDNQLFLL